MKKRNIYFIILTIVSIITITINIYNINKDRDYYIGRIESMDQKDGVITVQISPVPSKRYFISEIRANHQIKYADDIGISGISDPRKESKRHKLGGLRESIDNLKVGDNIIFKARNYDKNEYHIEIEQLAVDYTID